MKNLPLRSIMLLFACLIIAACDDDDDGSVTGTYNATTLAVEGMDVLSDGAFITLTLNEDGTTEGRIFVPDGDEDGGDFDQSLEGTWSQDGNTIQLDHPADTFLRDTDFEFRDNQLVGELGEVTVIFSKT